MSEELIKKMWARVSQCRRLAASTTDEKTAKVLLQMAEEGEADVRRHMAERDAQAQAEEPS